MSKYQCAKNKCLIFKVLMNATIIKKLIVQGHGKANITLNKSAISSFYAANSVFFLLTSLRQ